MIRLTTQTNYGKGGAGWLWPFLAALVAVPLIVAVIATRPTGVGNRNHIQDDLTARAQQALAGRGIQGTVTFAGRDATIHGVPAGSADAARDAVDAVDGVRVVSVESVGSDAGNPAPPSASATPADVAPFSVSQQGGRIALTGRVPDETTRKQLIDAAAAASGGKPVDDRLTVSTGAALPVAAADFGKVVAGVAALPSDGALTWNGRTVTLTGQVPSEDLKAAAEVQVRAIAQNAAVDNQLTVAAPTTQAPPPVDKNAVQQQINAIIAGAAITFLPNAADLTSTGAATVDQIGALLKGVPEVKVEVHGHVAAAPGKDPDPQVLSDQRAQAVAARLVALGVPADRITAKGFGDSQPLAPNNTPEGQAANRRVEIVVL